MTDPIEPEETDEPEAPETPEGDEPEEAEAPEPGEEALGDPGKRALEATKAKWKAERDKRIALERQLAAATAPKDGEPTPEQIRADVTREATQRANQRIVRAEVKSAATGLLENPAIALRLLDLTVFEVDDDGEVDADEITDAIKDLIAKEPYLAKQNSTPQGGSKKRIPEVPADPANKASTPVSHADKVKAAKAAGDWQAVIALENELLNQK